ncbi:SPBc2 prophage-derived glycosyltransferase SunS [Chlamydia abortus]|uniref:Glycosyltransferase n=1 Tax=Paenibacillus residui TaxID=629724 RepID=A0ABW3DAY7_9BACL|nr:SPBc2 prophage-derived glycosyltransferase SunS [Chlamydia abortus]
MSRPSISLCMIVKNEESCLESCLESVQGHVDEIIIVDTGSTDRTVEIAESFNARVIYHDWKQDFASARNESIKYATKEYILQLDADEYLDDRTDFVKALASELDFYYVNIRNYKTDGLSVAHKSVRLFKRRPDFIFVGRIHEQIDVNQPNVRGGSADVLIHHTGYTEDVYKEKNKHKRNMDILIQEVQQNRTGFNLYNLGNQYAQEGSYGKALSAFQEAFGLGKDRTYIPDLLSQMVICLTHLKRYAEGIRLANDAIAVYPSHADLYAVQGNLYKQMEHYEDALICYKHFLEIDESQPSAYTKRVESFLVEYLAAQVHMELGEEEEAYQAILRSLSLNRNYLPSKMMLVKWLQCRHKSGIEIISTINSSNSSDYNTVFSLLYNTRHPDLLQIIKSGSFNLEPYVKAVACLYAGEYEEARKLWNQIGEVNKDNGKDVLLLGVLTQDLRLLQMSRDVINLSDKEFKAVKSIMYKEPLQGLVPSSSLQAYLLELGRGFILVQEYDWFEYLSTQLSGISIRYRYLFSKLMHEYGFSEAAVDLILPGLRTEPHNPDLLQLLGDICRKYGNDEDALDCYKDLVRARPDMGSYTRLIRLLKRRGDKENVHKYKREMKMMYPLSNWAAMGD